jgi:hypothetical protein
MTVLTIDRRFCGPPQSGNGGYVCGRLAGLAGDAAEVTLLAPAPLDRPLDAHATGDGSWQLRDGARVIASARPVPPRSGTRERATRDEAQAARSPFDPARHPLPTCFVCGPHRAAGDGLRIRPGALPRRTAQGAPVLAACWTPDESLPAEAGAIAPECVWAALDCPTGFAAAWDPVAGGFDEVPVLLGRMAAQVLQRPRPGQPCVITAWPTGRDGRKRHAEAALWDAGGTLLASARATWIAVDRQVQLGAQPGAPPDQR